MSSEEIKPIIGRRTVCDNCRRRSKFSKYFHSELSTEYENIGIRCDGQQPCNHCIKASLSCKRDHKPRRRGPKRGSGRVISSLRGQDDESEKYETKPTAEASAIGSQNTGYGS